MTKKTKDFLKFLITGFAIAAFVFLLNSRASDDYIMRACDGFFVAGVLVMGFGGLKFARNQGTFDMMAFSVKSAFDLHVPGASIGNARDDKEDFIAYRDRKAAKRTSAAGPILAGLVHLVLSVILLVVYYLV